MNRVRTVKISYSQLGVGNNSIKSLTGTRSRFLPEEDAGSSIRPAQIFPSRGKTNRPAKGSINLAMGVGGSLKHDTPIVIKYSIYFVFVFVFVLSD